MSMTLLGSYFILLLKFLLFEAKSMRLNGSENAYAETIPDRYKNDLLFILKFNHRTFIYLKEIQNNSNTKFNF